ncbi:pilus assembly protein Flp/PilA [Paenarthrobacter nitroguajacolicus]|uniref:Flp family type IVb pilin n=1 Tax=Paenarthrobacter TaxID=1742992 RepID=UPI0028638C2F|nr:Flp family type IVb pilin [Paenarthrobacter nitroguajacolicus]MDR6987705.1 pilus assembly protein Flp/PilA [Paenarthrobacter nitroguajacolicus]
MSAFIYTITSYIAGVKDRFTQEEKGATMVEYGLMVSLIAIVAIAGLLILGPAVRDLFISIAGEL